VNKIKTLIPLSEFVSKIDEICPIEIHEMDYDHQGRQLQLIKRYNEFLLQKLELGMFIPVDANNNPTEDISNEGSFATAYYNEAKSKVIFEEFYTKQLYPPSKSFQVTDLNDQQICIYKDRPDYFIWNYETLEDLTKLNLGLTETGLKQIYGTI